MSRASRITLATLCLVFLSGASDCPLTMSTDSAGSKAAGGEGGSALDLGGASGAVWQVRFAQEVTVTVQAGGQAASAQVALQPGAVTVLGNSLDLASFCWRSDVVCPHQVLPARTVLVQPASWPGLVVSSFNPRGPLEAYQEAGGLGGRLDGSELSIPLAVSATPSGFCQLGAGSLLLGTASSSGEQDGRGDILQGRITVSYDGNCLNLGSGAVEPDAQVDLSMGFVAQRE